jgi:hypothetical protein
MRNCGLLTSLAILYMLLLILFDILKKDQRETEIAIGDAIVMVRTARKSGFFLICFYLFIFLFVLPYESLGQKAGEKQSPKTEFYFSREERFYKKHEDRQYLMFQ